jgi:hypothetical protein
MEVAVVYLRYQPNTSLEKLWKTTIILKDDGTVHWPEFEMSISQI